MVSSEHRSTHGGTPAVQGELRRVPLERRRQLMRLSDAIGAQPNQRVKLAAPAPVGLDASAGPGLYNYRCEHFSFAPQLTRVSLGSNACMGESPCTDQWRSR